MPKYEIQVNGNRESVDSWDPQQPLLYILRNTLGLRAAKFGCGLAQCGACTILLDGKPTRSCVTSIEQVKGHAVTTLEGLGSSDHPSRVQAAFIAEQAAQCGYCTNGMIMATEGLLIQKHNPTLEEAKQALSGNLCRCGTHTRILAAATRATKV